MSTLEQLATRLESLSERLEDDVNSAKIDAAIAIVQSFGEHTPVDTGRHVSSWEAGVNHRPSGDRPAFVPGDGGGSARQMVSRNILVIKGAQPGDRIFISNSAPAIKQLNEGASGQETGGFVQRAVGEGQRSIQRHHWDIS